jgi:hypothetical protein
MTEPEYFEIACNNYYLLSYRNPPKEQFLIKQFRRAGTCPIFFQGVPMPALPFKHSLSIVISVLLIFILFLTTWRIPSVGMTLSLIFLLFGLTAISYTIIQKNKRACQQGKIPLLVSIKNTCLEILAILLAMALAGLIGRSISIAATGNISSHPVKFITGIGVGLFVGCAVGLFIKQASSHFIKTSSDS